MAVHGYISLRDSSSLDFGDAVSAALRKSGEEAAHASGERTPEGWLISFTYPPMDATTGGPIMAGFTLKVANITASVIAT